LIWIKAFAPIADKLRVIRLTDAVADEFHGRCGALSGRAHSEEGSFAWLHRA